MVRRGGSEAHLRENLLGGIEDSFHAFLSPRLTGSSSQRTIYPSAYGRGGASASSQRTITPSAYGRGGASVSSQRTINPPGLGTHPPRVPGAVKAEPTVDDMDTRWLT